MAYGLGDVVQQRKMIDESEADDAHKRVQTGKLDALLGLCETAACRRVRLLALFRRNEPAVRQLRYLPRAAGVVGRDARGADGAFVRVSRVQRRAAFISARAI